MKSPASVPKRILRAIAATLLLALAGAAWLLVFKEPIKNLASDPIAREYGIENYYVGKDGFRHDNAGLTPEFEKAAAELEAEIAEATDKSGLTLGRVSFADRLLKKLLKERYSIQWRTLHEMNPEVIID